MGITELPTAAFHMAKDHITQEKHVTLFMSHLHPLLLQFGGHRAGNAACHLHLVLSVLCFTLSWLPPGARNNS